VTDPVSPLTRTLELLRRQMAEHARTLEGGARSGATSTPGGRTEARGDLGTLKRRVTERMQAIDPADPNASRRRRRVFLESVLAWEFGEELLRDPGFQAIIDRVDDAIAAEPELERQFATALKDT
jgi:hypothetical protein